MRNYARNEGFHILFKFYTFACFSIFPFAFAFAAPRANEHVYGFRKFGDCAGAKFFSISFFFIHRRRCEQSQINQTGERENEPPGNLLNMTTKKATVACSTSQAKFINFLCECKSARCHCCQHRLQSLSHSPKMSLLTFPMWPFIW